MPESSTSTRTVPVIVPISHFAGRVLQISRGDNVIAIEHRTSSVPGDSHAHDFWNARTNQISRGSALVSDGRARKISDHNLFEQIKKKQSCREKS
jgi:hypothetical protein